MSYGKSVSITCEICSEQFQHAKKLSNHIKKIHEVPVDEYCAKYMYHDARPVCKECGSSTRFVSITEGFKKYCHKHARLAMSKAGHVGGAAPAWNRGMTKETDKRVAHIAKSLSGTANPFYGKRHTDETKKKNADSKRLSFPIVVSRIEARHSDILVLSTAKDYISQDSPLNVLCSVCNTTDSVSFFNLMRCWRCRKCFPVASAQQLEVATFIASLVPDEEIVLSTRNIISPLELDIWLPSQNLAIEYHGLFWHSGGKDGTFDKKRHREKYLACRDKGIRLIQLFSDEWLTKRSTCESILRHALKKEMTKINARDCDIRHVSVPDAKKFLESSHMSGYTICNQRYGLFHPGLGLVGIATTRRPIQKKHGNDLIELARMAFMPGISVRGGASKLLITIERELSEKYTGIVSYAELRFGEGKVYELAGMERLSDAPINYWYTDGVTRFNRFAFRATGGKSEKEVAAEANVRPVYGCGNAVYVKRWK